MSQAVRESREETLKMALLDGKVAIITGAGRGIGREEALLMAKQGAKVVVNDLGGHFDGTGQSRSPAEEVVKEIRASGGEAVANFESVTDFRSAKRIIDCAIDNFGKLNAVVNNAGILRDRMIFNMSEEDFDATPQTAATMPQPKTGEVDRFSPTHVAPLVAWLASDDAKDVHGEVFRVGLGNVWLMRGWHSAGKITQSGPLKFWDPTELGARV